jgi:hypothetical protein
MCLFLSGRLLATSWHPSSAASCLREYGISSELYARLHRFPPTFVWAREIHCDHTGEHLHVLMHVPDRLFGDFQQRLVKWFPGPGEMDVRAAHYRVTLTDSGKRKSAISYICKQMTPQAWWGRHLIRVAGGRILGKRGGVSANLTSKAINLFNRERIEPVRNGGGATGLIIDGKVAMTEWETTQHRLQAVATQKLNRPDRLHAA